MIILKQQLWLFLFCIANKKIQIWSARTKQMNMNHIDIELVYITNYEDLNIAEEIYSFKMWPQEKGLGHHNAAGDV